MITYNHHMPKKILQKEASVLRKTAESVPISDIGSPKIQNIIHEMKEALFSQDDGVAIAAPQIGYSLRIFVISEKVDGFLKKSRPKNPRSATKTDGSAQVVTASPPTVFINPVIKKVSKEKKILEEGCLSVRYLYGKVSRGNKATIQAYDERGKKFERGGVGLLAQIFQHEVDHLNGILFIDKAKYIEEIMPKHVKQPASHATKNNKKR